MMSPAFSLDVLRGCRQRGINTQIETSLFASPETADAFAEVSDKIIADIKLIDPLRHKQATGVDNALILQNIRRLAEKGTNLLLRVPLIPGFTDDEDNIRGIAAFVASLKRDIPVELLNFNPMCREKYDSLRQTYPFDPDHVRYRNSVWTRETNIDRTRSKSNLGWTRDMKQRYKGF
jgi:pyruvate formate lyase activating enzyme